MIWARIELRRDLLQFLFGQLSFFRQIDQTLEQNLVGRVDALARPRCQDVLLAKIVGSQVVHVYDLGSPLVLERIGRLARCDLAVDDFDRVNECHSDLFAGSADDAVALECAVLGSAGGRPNYNNIALDCQDLIGFGGGVGEDLELSPE